MVETLSVHKDTVHNWEANRTSPPLRFLPRIIQFLGYVPYDTQHETLSERIVYYRRILGFTQRELARRLGVDPTTLSRWDRGDGKPSKKLTAKVGVFLGSVPSDNATLNHEVNDGKIAGRDFCPTLQ